MDPQVKRVRTQALYRAMPQVLPQVLKVPHLVLQALQLPQLLLKALVLGPLVLHLCMPILAPLPAAEMLGASAMAAVVVASLTADCLACGPRQPQRHRRCRSAP